MTTSPAPVKKYTFLCVKFISGSRAKEISQRTSHFMSISFLKDYCSENVEKYSRVIFVSLVLHYGFYFGTFVQNKKLAPSHQVIDCTDNVESNWCMMNILGSLGFIVDGFLG